jgi:hypothetical protein
MSQSMIKCKHILLVVGILIGQLAVSSGTEGYYVLEGQLFDGKNVLANEQVTVWLNDSTSQTVLTDSSGNFSFTVNWIYFTSYNMDRAMMRRLNKDNHSKYFIFEWKNKQAKFRNHWKRYSHRTIRRKIRLKEL